MTSMNASEERLDSAWKALRARWEDTGSKWNDSVRRAFENEYWEPLEAQVRSTLDELQRLAQVIAQAERNVR